jgi:hypothetical protein
MIKMLIAVVLGVTASAADAQARVKKGAKDVCVGVPSITRHEIRMTMLASTPRFRRCFAAAEMLLAEAKVRFEIIQSGAVQKVTVDGQPAEAGSTTWKRAKRCVAANVRKLRFPPLRYKLGQTVKVSYPLVSLRTGLDARPAPKKLDYPKGDALAVRNTRDHVAVTLPRKAREALAALKGYRLPRRSDLDPAARRKTGFPFPFAVVGRLDSTREGDDLAVTLASTVTPGRWQLVALHRQPDGSYRLRSIARSDRIRRHFPETAALFVTSGSRCFCERRCVSLASDAGTGLELEWNGKRYTHPGKLERYLAR